ncbi:MAG: LptF/LptG family permease [Planctomycetota bacterium]
MPFTLYRYIGWELLKLLALSTTVLVLVISFAATIKPLSDGLLSPWAMVKFIAYTAPTMLTFALPFSGAFAATLLFIRLAGDNEVQACSASGISYRSILFPVAAIGLALTMGLFFMANYVIPGFYRGAARTIEADVMTALVSRLNEDQAFGLGDVLISADRAGFGDVAVLPEAVGSPRDHIMLQGVTVHRLGADGAASFTGTAGRADVLVYDLVDGTGVQMNLQDVWAYDPAMGAPSRLESMPLQMIRVPGFFRDKPKFLSMPELRRLRENPERFEAVARHRDAVVRELVERRLWERLRVELGTQRGIELAGPLEGERYRLSAPEVERVSGGFVVRGTEAEPVRLVRRLPGAVPRRFQAMSGSFEVVDDTRPEEVVLTGTLAEVRAVDARAGRLDNARREQALPRLTVAEALIDRPAEQIGYAEALAMAGEDGSRRVVDAADRMVERVRLLGRRVMGHVNERAASSVACLLLMLMGALLAILNKGRMPLVVYFWSFLTAIAVVVIVNIGQRTAGDANASLGVGLAVLWSGNAALVAALGLLYAKVARH